MSNEPIAQAIHALKALGGRPDQPAIQHVIQLLESAGDRIAIGEISSSTGVAIGRDIRMVINQVNLPAEAVAMLLDARSALGTTLGLDPRRYWPATLIANKAAGFVGREYVFKALESFLAHQPCGYFIVEADPGMGKSAVLAEYVRRTGCLAHFNVRAQGIDSPWQFLQNVCAQIVVDYGLSYSSLPADATEDGAFLASLLAEASARPQPSERLVIAVDALDEVDPKSYADGGNVLYLPPTLPKGVYFILTKRPETLPLVIQAPQESLDLMAHPAENRQDVEVFLSSAVGGPKLGAWIEGQHLSADEFVSVLAERSESNFMYLRYVLPEIEQGAYSNLNLDELPAGLEGYYEDHWQRMGMMAKPLPETKIRIVYVLAESKQPASCRMIAQFVRLDELTVQAVLDEWDQFLHKQDVPYEGGTQRRYSVYHDSFRGFLHRKDIVQAAGVTISDVSKQISTSLWESLLRKKQQKEGR